LQTLPERKRTFIFCASLALLAFLPFVSLLNADFVHWDDDVYVTDNARVREGVTPGNIAWAFSTTYFGFYYPVTWISHMLDCSLFGLKAGGHHLTSIVIHLFNVFLLFFFFRRSTLEGTKSFILSAVFAIHPLNVESVAWISERKNLLAGFFFLLGMNLYLGYARSPKPLNFAKVFCCYLLGLMSKSSLVTFAPALLLLDIWPLGRLRLSERFSSGNRKVLLEKAVLLVPVPIFSYLTIVAQKDAGALGTLEKFPMDDRIAGAVLAVGRYLVQFFAPVRLTAMYPHLGSDYSIPLLVLSAASIIACTVAFSVVFPRNGKCLVGWLWFLGNLVPVLGLIQVGGQASADRYMYIPMAGLLMIVIFGTGDLIAKLRPAGRSAVLAAAALFPLFFLAKTVDQAAAWKNSESLFSAMTVVSPRASQGHYNMGIIMQNRGDIQKAEEFYRRAIECDPEKGQAYNNLGNCLAQKGDYKEAIEMYELAAKFDPRNPMVHFNWGLAEDILGQKESAGKRFEEARQLATGDEALTRKIENSLETLKRLSSGQPSGPEDGQFNELVEKAMALGDQNRWAEAQALFEEVLAGNPGDDRAWALLGYSLQCQGKSQEADAAFNRAIELNPHWSEKIDAARKILSSGSVNSGPETRPQ